MLPNVLTDDIKSNLADQHFKPKKSKVFFEKFVRARSNKKLRESQRKFLTEFCGQDSIDSKAIIDKLVGKKLRADSFGYQRLRKKKTLKRLVESWSNCDPDIDLATILKLATRYVESSSDFAARLNEEKLASMKQLAYGASHEINNPLANVATRAQTMLAVETDPEKRHKLAVIYEQAMRAHEMISDMMLFAHPPALKREQVSVRLMISRLINQLNPKYLSDPRIATTFTVAAGVDQVDVDPTQISVAIRSLIQNSLRSTDFPAEFNQTSTPSH